MPIRSLTMNALMAAAYAVVALILPATALANYRLATALYVLAAINPRLVPGLAAGNALAGLPQGPLDLVLGLVVGCLTAWGCARAGERWAPAVVLVVPTLLVPLWLSWMFGATYLVVMLAVGKGQAVSALIGWGILRVPQIRRALPK